MEVGKASPGRTLSRLLPPAAYLGVALLLTWPVVLHFRTHLLTSSFDSLIHLWLAWHIQEHGFLSFAWTQDTPLLFHPFGANVAPGGGAAHLHGLLVILGLIGLEKVLEPVAAWNALLVFCAWSSGYAVYLLALEVTGSRPSAFLAGLAVMASHGYLEELYEGVLEQTFLAPGVLTVLLLIRLARAPSGRAAALAALGLLLTGLTSVYHLLIVIAVAGILLMMFAPRPARGPLLLVLLLACWAVGSAGPWTRIAARVLSPQTAREVVGSQHAALGAMDEVRVIRGGLQPANFLSRGQVQRLRGYVLGAAQFLALFAALVAFRQSRPWLAAAGLFALASLGPYTLGPKDELLAHGPGSVLYALFPPLAVLRPARFFIAAQVACAVAGAVGVGVLLRSLDGRPLVRTLVPCGLGALILADLFLVPPRLFPCPEIPARVPEFHRALADEPGRPATLEWPLFPVSKPRLFPYLQTLHGKPLVNSTFLDTVSQERLARWTRSNSMIGFLIAMASPVEGQAPEALREEDVRNLEESGIRYLVVDAEPENALMPPVEDGTDLFSTRLLDVLRQALGPATDGGDGLLVFRVAPSDRLRQGPVPIPDPRQYERLSFQRQTLLFPPALVPQYASARIDDPSAPVERLSFWYRATGRDTAFRVRVLAVSEDEREALSPETPLLGSAEVWRRVEIPLASSGSARALEILVERPTGRDTSRLEIARVEGMR